MNLLHGTGVALVTPFNKKQQIDFDALERLLVYTAQQGVDYWVVQGTTGEAATTTPEEKKELLAFVKEHNPANLPIVYGIGGPHTAAICHQLETLEAEGVTAFLSITPYYNRPSQEGLFLHYQRLAEAAPRPLILYNVPARTGTHLAPETVIKLSQLPNIVGIKEASGQVVDALAIQQGTDEDFVLLAGDDALTLSLMAIGAVGVISTVANVAPAAMVALVQAARNQDYVEARKNLYTLLPLCQFIAQHGNPVGTKQLMAACGLCNPDVRLPLSPLAPSFLPQAQERVRHLVK